MGRLLRISRIIAFLKVSGDVKAGLRIFKMVLYLIVYLHCYSCLWWYQVKESAYWIPNRFVMLSEDEFYTIYGMPLLKQYLISMMHAVLAALGSDITPRDTLQTVIAAIGLFFGAIINANIFGELAMIFS